MKCRIPAIAIVAHLATALALAAQQQAPPSQAPAPHYPPARRSASVDEVGGVRVADPYRWMEDVTSAETRSWIDAENAVTASYLAQLPAATRQRLRDRLTQFWTYPKLRPPFGGGERSFFYENSGIENHAALYVQDRKETAPRVLLDPNVLARDGSVAIVTEAASPDGKYLAYVTARRGAAWRDVRVRDVRSGQDLPDSVRGVRHGQPAWTNDERGFFYVRTGPDSAATMANPLGIVRGERVFYHQLGEKQHADQLVYERRDHPDWMLDVTVSEDGQYAVITARRGVERNNSVYFIDLDRPRRPNIGAPIVTLVDVADARYEFVSSQGSLFYLLTTKDAPRGRVVGVDINAPQQTRWLTVVRETFDALVAARRVDDRVVAHRIRDAHSILELYALDGAARGEVHLPSVGTVSELSGRERDREFYFAFTSYLVPPTIFRYDLETRAAVSHKDARTEPDLSNYETTDLFYSTADGARVPMSISARRDMVLDGSHPAILAVHGALGEVFLPTFSPEVATWLDLGGVYAVAHVRGGGEYGRAWHDQAIGARKQTTVNDVIAAAEFLVAQRYTRASTLVIAGRGHGGLAAAAAMIQRPRLFGAALLDGAPTDMARFDRLATGWSWIPEYGSPTEPAQLAALVAYSPLHAVRDGAAYPATLMTVGESDGRVPPVHSYKLVAALQAAQPNGPPALLRVERDAGSALSIRQQIDVAADRLAFLAMALGLR